MSNHNPYGGTQADLINAAGDSFRLKQLMRELLTEIHTAKLTDIPPELQNRIHHARWQVDLPDVTVKPPKPCTTCLSSFFNNPPIRKPFP